MLGVSDPANAALGSSPRPGTSTKDIQTWAWTSVPPLQPEIPHGKRWEATACMGRAPARRAERLPKPGNPAVPFGYGIRAARLCPPVMNSNDRRGPGGQLVTNPAPQNIPGQGAGDKAEDVELSCPTERGRNPTE